MNQEPPQESNDQVFDDAKAFEKVRDAAAQRVVVSPPPKDEPKPKSSRAETAIAVGIIAPVVIGLGAATALALESKATQVQDNNKAWQDSAPSFDQNGLAFNDQSPNSYGPLNPAPSPSPSTIPTPQHITQSTEPPLASPETH